MNKNNHPNSESGRAGGRMLKEVDLAILAALQENGRITHSEPQGNVNLTRGAVAERVEYMERKKIIRGYRVVIDHGKLRDYSPQKPSLFLVFTEVTLRDEGSRAPFLEYIAKTAEIIACWRATASYSYLVHCACPNSARYEQLISEMQAAFNVGINGHVVLSAQKQFEGYPIGLYKLGR